MALVNKDFDIRWGLLKSSPRLIFSYPPDVASDVVILYHGLSNNVPNTQRVKTVLRTLTAGNVYNFRDVGHEAEIVRLDVVLATKEEALDFTNFFKNVIKGSSNIFRYTDNVTGVSKVTRLLSPSISMGESTGDPYSFSLLMKVEEPYTTKSVSVSYDIVQAVIATAIPTSHGNYSFIIQPTSSTTLWSTGYNVGQLGVGHTIDTNRFGQEALGKLNWDSISGGDNHSHAIDLDGKLYSAGANDFGQLGTGDTLGTILTSFIQLGFDTWGKIAAGRKFSVGIKTNGTMWSWGKNDNSQLGQGTADTNDHPTPAQIGTDTDWVDVRCGWDFTIAKKSDGTIWSFGQNVSGECGLGFTSPRESNPVKIGTDTDWGSFECGWGHTLALKNNGFLYSWGKNGDGEIGDGTSIDRWSPVLVSSTVWISIGAGTQWSMGIKLGGTLWTWGFNANNELGIGGADSDPHYNPIKISLDTDWAVCGAGYSHGIASKTNLEIYSWGWNGFGECGVGNNASVTVPTRTFLTSVGPDLKWDIIEGGGPPPPPPP